LSRRGVKQTLKKGDADKFKFTVQSRIALIRVGVLLALVLGIVGGTSQIALAAGMQNTVIQVQYYGTNTTFEALFATDKEVHCITQQTKDLLRRGVFDPVIDKVLCFDTIAEVDREFTHMRLLYLNAEKSTKGTESTDWFALYRESFYNNWWYDLSSDNANVTQPVWSVWENGIAAMRVYKGTNFTGSSWLITDSVGTLGSGWGGAVKSIDWL
jgi:hypothetical protein